MALTKKGYRVRALTRSRSSDSPDLARFTGDSFRDLTRIARIDDRMWSELFMCNRDALLEQMDIFIETFGRMRTALSRGDVTTLRSMMQRSTEYRTFR